MEQLGWLRIGQHQLQQDVTHGLAFVLVDGRDDELDFADLIGVFLLDGYRIFPVSYTHLDVYKRQVPGFADRRRNP